MTHDAARIREFARSYTDAWWISGVEECTIGDDGLVVESRGNYDQDEYARQLEHGAPET